MLGGLRADRRLRVGGSGCFGSGFGRYFAGLAEVFRPIRAQRPPQPPRSAALAVVRGPAPKYPPRSHRPSLLSAPVDNAGRPSRPPIHSKRKDSRRVLHLNLNLNLNLQRITKPDGSVLRKPSGGDVVRAVSDPEASEAGVGVQGGDLWVGLDRSVEADLEPEHAFQHQAHPGA